MQPGTQLKIQEKGEREIVWTRGFDAPASFVFDALTKPQLIQRWLLGPDGWTMPVCEVDLRVGGAYRYVWSHPQKGQMGLGGIYKEIVKPQRIVHTEKFDDPWYSGEALISTELVEIAGKTTMTSTMLLDSKQTRDGVLKSGMESGMVVSYNRLDAIVAELAG